MAITGQLTLNEILIVEVDGDPSTGGGATAPIGSFALLDDKTNGRMWIKSGSGDTAWSIVPRLANGTAFTPGSIIFADATGFLSQNNASLFWDANNIRLGLGYNSPQAKVHIDGGNATASAIKFTAGTTTGQTSGDGFDIGIDTAGNAELRQRENSVLSIFTANIQAFAVTPAQRVLISSSQTSQSSASGEDSHLQIHGLTSVDTQLALMRWSADANSAVLRFTKSRGTTIGSHAVLSAADFIGSVSFRASDGVNYFSAASINALADAATATNSVPGRLAFYTTPSGSTTGVERLRIDNAGRTIVMGVGGAAAQDITGASAFPLFQIIGTSAVQMAGIQFSADTIGPVFNILKSRGTTVNTQGLVLQDDEFGRIQFRASDGTNFQAGASIRALVDGTAAANSMPGRLILMTTPSGSTTPVERMRISQNGLVRVVDAFQSYRRIEDFQAQNTANSTLTLTSASAGIQAFTGSTAGQIVRLPDATTLVVGAAYELRNLSSAIVTIQDNAGGALETIPTGTGALVAILSANGTAAGSWFTQFRFEPYSNEVSSTSSFNLTSTTDVLITGMTITPPAGTYVVSFTSTINMATANATYGCGIYVDGTQNANSDRAYQCGTVSFGTFTPGTLGLATSGTVTVNGSQAIEIRARRSTGTTTVGTRTLTIVRVG